MTDDAPPPHPTASWPSGGGKMGARIRAHDWRSTPLGESAAWQQSLKTSVEILLGTGFPMILLSGVDLVRIYNDAFADLMAAEAGDGFGISARTPVSDFFEIDASILDRVLEGKTVTLDDSRRPTIRRGRGADTWLDATFSPARDDAGEIAGVIVIALDVTHYVRAERDLAAELQHRVRNSLSVIRSIARRTAENSETLDEFADHLDGRLGAFARVQGAVVSYGARGIDLHAMIVDEMDAAAAQEGDRFTLSGQEVSLDLKTSETLGLAFHELATNAIKFGALAFEGGSIAISWNVEEKGDATRLAILWQERRPGPPLSKPKHMGFGTDLLERTLEYELEARTTLEYRPTGLYCTIDLPLASGTAAKAKKRSMNFAG